MNGHLVRAPQQKRAFPRHTILDHVSASLKLDTGESVLVRIADISRRGARVVRMGPLGANRDDLLTLEIFDYNSGVTRRLRSRICWLQATPMTSIAGLSFVDGPLKPGTFLDEFLDRSILAR